MGSFAASSYSCSSWSSQPSLRALSIVRLYAHILKGKTLLIPFPSSSGAEGLLLEDRTNMVWGMDASDQDTSSHPRSRTSTYSSTQSYDQPVPHARNDSFQHSPTTPTATATNYNRTNNHNSPNNTQQSLPFSVSTRIHSNTNAYIQLFPRNQSPPPRNNQPPTRMTHDRSAPFDSRRGDYNQRQDFEQSDTERLEYMLRNGTARVEGNWEGSRLQQQQQQSPHYPQDPWPSVPSSYRGDYEDGSPQSRGYFDDDEPAVDWETVFSQQQREVEMHESPVFYSTQPQRMHNHQSRGNTLPPHVSVSPPSHYSPVEPQKAPQRRSAMEIAQEYRWQKQQQEIHAQQIIDSHLPSPPDSTQPAWLPYFPPGSGDAVLSPFQSHAFPIPLTPRMPSIPSLPLQRPWSPPAIPRSGGGGGQESTRNVGLNIRNLSSMDNAMGYDTRLSSSSVGPPPSIPLPPVPSSRAVRRPVATSAPDARTSLLTNVPRSIPLARLVQRNSTLTTVHEEDSSQLFTSPSSTNKTNSFSRRLGSSPVSLLNTRTVESETVAGGGGGGEYSRHAIVKVPSSSASKKLAVVLEADENEKENVSSSESTGVVAAAVVHKRRRRNRCARKAKTAAGAA